MYYRNKIELTPEDIANIVLEVKRELKKHKLIEKVDVDFDKLRLVFKKLIDDSIFSYTPIKNLKGKVTWQFERFEEQRFDEHFIVNFEATLAGRINGIALIVKNIKFDGGYLYEEFDMNKETLMKHRQMNELVKNLRKIVLLYKYFIDTIGDECAKEIDRLSVFYMNSAFTVQVYDVFNNLVNTKTIYFDELDSINDLAQELIEKSCLVVRN